MSLHSVFFPPEGIFLQVLQNLVIATGTNFTSVCHLSSFLTLCPSGRDNNMAYRHVDALQ